MEDETKFHWSEGMKFALEGIKTLFLLNGAATVSILTFIGNTNAESDELVYSMIFFAVGALTGPPAFFCAYLTQLNYGNSVRSQTVADSLWASASRLHFAAYALVVLGMGLFLLGVVIAGCALRA